MKMQNSEKLKNLIKRVKMEKNIVRTPGNIVTSLVYYMWNSWNEKECSIVFEGDMHFWIKWGQAWNLCGGPVGATEMMWSEMDESNREKLINRALEKYNGNTEIKK